MTGRRFWVQVAFAAALLVTVALVVFAVQVFLITHGRHSTGITTRIVTTIP